MCYPFLSYFGYVEFSLVLLFHELTNIPLLYVKHYVSNGLRTRILRNVAQEVH